MVYKGWDLWASILLASIIAAIAPIQLFPEALRLLAIAELGVASTLVGVILAGLAILAVFLEESYLCILEQAGGGFEEDLFPFWFTAGLAVYSIVLNVLVIVLANSLSLRASRVLLGLSVWVFLWALFASLNLVAFVAGHAANRAQLVLKKRHKD